MHSQTMRNITLAVILLAAAAVPSRVSGLVIKGHFPLYEGMYWNFSKSGDTLCSSWAMLGSFSQEKIGTVSILLQEHARFLAVRMEWDGLYLYGEYGPEGFCIPDQPLLFFPAALDFDKPLESAARLAVFCAGENVKQTGTINRRVSFALKGVEDMTIDGREIRNCAIIEKTTRDNATETIETMWMAPTIGPVRREVRAGSSLATYVLTSTGGNRERAAQGFAAEEYFPLRSGSAVTYQEPSGSRVVVEHKPWEQKAGWSVMPYVESSGNIYYLAHNDSGLVAPVKYTAMAGMGVVYLPPDRPLVLLPRTIRPGALHTSTSYYRVSQWPSISPMLDFYPEARIAGVVLGAEDVATPSGVHKGCLKVALVMVSSAFAMQREKLKAGCVWLAKDVGIVKQESVSYDNTYLAETPNFIFDVQQWERVKAETLAYAAPQSAVPNGNALPGAEQGSAASLPLAEVQWSGNSKAMFDKAVQSAPAFVQSTVKANLLQALAAKAGPDKIVTESMLIEAVKAVTPDAFEEKMISDLKPLMSP